MPIYEYQCTSCGQKTEAIQRFSDAPLEKCSACGGKLKKLLSNSSFVLKGSGWYVTDYARKGKTHESSPKKPSKEAKSDGASAKSSCAGCAKVESK